MINNPKTLSIPTGMIVGILFAVLVLLLGGMLYSLPQQAYCTIQPVTVRLDPADNTTASIEDLGRVADLPAGKRVYPTIDTTPAFWVLVQFWDGLEIKRGWVGLGSIDLCPGLSTSSVALLFSGIVLLLVGTVTLFTWRPA
jgi:hypothetical protein